MYSSEIPNEEWFSEERLLGKMKRWKCAKPTPAVRIAQILKTPVSRVIPVLHDLRARGIVTRKPDGWTLA